MKFHFPSLKQLVILLLTVLVCIVLGWTLLTITHTMFKDRVINEHVKETVGVFKKEGVYPEIDPEYTSILDNWTDSLMLKKAAYDGPESAAKKALLSLHWELSEGTYSNPVEEFIQYYSREVPEPRHASSYARYWHGYLLILRPALYFFNYEQISGLNLYLQLALMLVVCVLMAIKKCWKAIPAYIISILEIGILPVAYSLQYSTILYVFSIFSVILLLLNEKMKERETLIFYVVVGAATSYMDFLTYPIATFGMTTVMYLCINYDNTAKVDVRNIINLFIVWIIGYVGMWAGKWILATIFTDQNVIKDAFDAIRFRSSREVSAETIKYSYIVRRNLDYYFNTSISKMFVALIVLEIICSIIFKNKANWKMIISGMFIATLPFIWYAIAGNHSYIHAWFTNKALISSSFAILVVMLPWNPQKLVGKKSIKKSNKNKSR